jgi:ribosomal-protein-alanine N-acetyltransferase
MTEIPTLQTTRLLLRPFALSDAPTVQLLAGDIAIADTTLNLPHPYADGMAESWISKHSEAFAKEEGLTLAIVNKPDGVLVGAISLMGIAKGHQAELGYWIGKPYWHQGYCTEAAQALVLCAFTKLGLLRVYASHFSRNPASGRIMQKLGMQHEGTRRQHIRKWDKLEDLELYGILKDEWEAAQSRTHSADR